MKMFNIHHQGRDVSEIDTNSGAEHWGVLASAYFTERIDFGEVR